MEPVHVATPSTRTISSTSPIGTKWPSSGKGSSVERLCCLDVEDIVALHHMPDTVCHKPYVRLESNLAGYEHSS